MARYEDLFGADGQLKAGGDAPLQPESTQPTAGAKAWPARSMGTPGLKKLTIEDKPAALDLRTPETKVGETSDGATGNPAGEAVKPSDLPRTDGHDPRQVGTPAAAAAPVAVAAPIPASPVVSPSQVTVADLTSVPFAYLKGPAGTGKTWLARQIIKERDDAILCATTGIAAVNLGDACTVNSLLGYFDTPGMMDAYASGWLSTRLRQLRRSGIRILVLDEVSMLDADQLTVLCQALDDVNRKKSYDADLEQMSETVAESLEMKLILVGDFAQLPPVKASFAFQSNEWARFSQRTFALSVIRRQGDSHFAEALGHVRRGHAEKALPILEPRIAPVMDFKFRGTTIVATNQEVDRINQLRHSQLAGEMLEWATLRSGEQQKDWIRLIPEKVELKIGALVMILANMPFARMEGEEWAQGYHYVNGDLATVVGKEDHGIRVMLHRTFAETTVVPMTSEWREPTGKKKPAYTVRGAVTRMPLRLAYATTVHKSQGLSLDEVQVSLANWMFNKPGMTYVALSRCRTLEGLRIVGNPKMFLGKCAVDPVIGAFL